ncbi:MAG: asparagine synthase (glutamine-hydrolyzing) [Sediminibacterium sp.]|nr:asparagine synthase (glutamine-hydrolyzing) [Sediminibacterium sp.]
MCGINGIVSDTLTEQEHLHKIGMMNEALQHRGPDHTGTYYTRGVSLGHTRLSIIDLSSDGNQPFYSSDRRYVLVFNGELYNYRELKLELQRVGQGTSHQPYFFKTGTDTEVILAAFLRWGKQCVQYLNGMFAFAVYDSQTGEMFIARDRFGVKPLYYHYGQNGFVFSSEIRAILKSGIKSFELNRQVLAEYTQYQTVSAPNTIVKGIQVLLPGHYLEVKNGKVEQAAYWQPEQFVRSQESLSYEATCDKIRELLTLSVQRRLVADVPFGAFLSGGIDSSIVVGLMASVSSEPVQTFNVSFDESAFSESVYAKAIAQRFNTRHHEIRLTPSDFLNELPVALKAMDHPGGDGINTFIVSKATKDAGITMALSGIGGDELFAGYANFKRLYQLHHNWKLKVAPELFRKAAGSVIQQFSNSISKAKIAEVLKLPGFGLEHTYPLSRSLFTVKELSRLVKVEAGGTKWHDIIKKLPVSDGYLLSAVSVLEMKSYLHDVLLRDTDQMAMAVALEVREPFLDYKLAEYVLGIKDDWKFPHTPKKLLTDSVKGLIPDDSIHRPKMGFTLPWALWLKNELKLFCEQQMNDLENAGLYNPQSVTGIWKRFLNNDPKVSWSRVWHLVVLQHWLKQNGIG